MAEHGIVVDGYARLVAALRPAVVEEVKAEYAERLANAASWFERWRLRRRMAREIDRRSRPDVSKEALF